MFGIGSFRSRDCQGLTRRSFLRVGASLPFAAGLSAPTREAIAAEAPKARSVMLVWLVGGPSHLDLFDPKPELERLHGKPIEGFPESLPRDVQRLRIPVSRLHAPERLVVSTGQPDLVVVDRRGWLESRPRPHQLCVRATRRGIVRSFPAEV